MQHIRASEIVFGLVLDNLINPDSVDASYLHAPYDGGIRILQSGGHRSDLLDTVGIHAINISKAAAASIDKGMDVLTYVEICTRAAIRMEVAQKLRPIVERLERGEDIEVAGALSALSALENGYAEFTTADLIKPESAIYVPSNYPPLDSFVGGFPLAGLTIVAGITGTGKTTFLIELARRSARAGKHCAILSLEMTSGQIMYRMLEIDPYLTDPEKRCIHLSDSVYDIDEAMAAAARISAKEELNFIGIDYADLLVGTKEQSEATMGRIYNGLAVLAKKILTPVVLVAQYRRTNGELPTIEDIRYSGRAEQAASLILLLYNQDLVWSRSIMDSQSNILPYSPGCAWILVGKARYRGNQPTPMGAIKVEWDEKGGGRWGDVVGANPWFNLTGRT